MNQPNILLITDDQHRWDYFTGGRVPALKTPNWDRLRNEGATFTNATTNCPICMPARFAWCHGLYPSQAASSLLSNAHSWPTGLPSMPGNLQQAGYHTALIGKLHSHAGLYHCDVVELEEETRARGFDDVFEVSGKSIAYCFDCHWTRHLERIGLLERYRDDLAVRQEITGGMGPSDPTFLSREDSMDGFIGRHAAEWLKGYSDEKPFFLHTSFCGPHFPIDPPEEYHRMYKPEDMPMPEGVEDPERIKHIRKRTAAYCALVKQIDDEIGVLLDTLESRGLLENTVILYGTDHGDMMGDLGQTDKFVAHDASSRTPYTIRWAGKIPPSQTLEGPVESVDLPATIMEIAGLTEDMETYLPGSPGRSFLSYACGDAEPTRDWAYSEGLNFANAWRMCREADWKYVMGAQKDALYCLSDDPWEQNNLVNEPEQLERVANMRHRLAQRMMEALPPDSIPMPPIDYWWGKREKS